jgi:hypothetical protein
MSDVIHESKTILRGGNKCYKELKKMGKINVNEFEVKNLDDNQIYKFKINTQTGGSKFDTSEIIRKLDDIEKKLENYNNNIMKKMNLN